MSPTRFALIDNGSLAPAAHAALQAAAEAVSAVSGLPVEAVSWKHSPRHIAAWIPEVCAAGAQRLVFLPYFISPQGAIGGALRRDIEALRPHHGFTYEFTAGLTPAVLARIAADHVRATLAAERVPAAHVILVDHGGPSPLSAAVRNATAAHLAPHLGPAALSLTAASMESPGPEAAHNLPLLAEALVSLAERRPPLILIAPLFLSPGRHAGPEGDLARIAGEALAGVPAAARPRVAFTALMGAHPRVAATFAAALSPFLTVAA